QCLRGDAEQAGDVASRRIRGPETRLVAAACVRHEVGGDLLAGTAVVETRTPDGIVAKSRAPGGQGPHRELRVAAENPQELRAGDLDDVAARQGYRRLGSRCSGDDVVDPERFKHIHQVQYRRPRSLVGGTDL